MKEGREGETDTTDGAVQGGIGIAEGVTEGKESKNLMESSGEFLPKFSIKVWIIR